MSFVRRALLLGLPALIGAPAQALESVPLPVVSVVTVAPREIVDRAIISGTLVPRDEVLVAPELDGLRLTDVLVEEGDHVEKGQVLARLNREMLDTQVAQNKASIARAEAAIDQEHAGIDQAEAAQQEASLSLTRAQTLMKSGNFTEATLEQRVSAARSADGRLAASKNGLAIAEADLALAKAQGDDLALRIARTEIRAPIDGIISRKAARVGATASTNGEPLFRIIARGRIELEGEVTETALGELRPGAAASITVDGGTKAEGTVRAVYPEIDRASRLGKIRSSWRRARACTSAPLRADPSRSPGRPAMRCPSPPCSTVATDQLRSSSSRTAGSTSAPWTPGSPPTASSRLRAASRQATSSWPAQVRSCTPATRCASPMPPDRSPDGFRSLRSSFIEIFRCA